MMAGCSPPAFRSVRQRLSVVTGVWLDVSRNRRLRRRALRRRTWRSAYGQTTTEWLMVAGLLTAVGIFLLRLLPATIRGFSEALVYSLRTIAP